MNIQLGAKITFYLWPDEIGTVVEIRRSGESLQVADREDDAIRILRDGAEHPPRPQLDAAITFACSVNLVAQSS